MTKKKDPSQLKRFNKPLLGQEAKHEPNCSRCGGPREAADPKALLWTRCPSCR